MRTRPWTDQERLRGVGDSNWVVCDCRHPRRHTWSTQDAETGSMNHHSSGAMPEPTPGFRVAEAKDHLSTVDKGSWVLAHVDGHPAAFLTPAAAVEATGAPSLIAYLLSRKSGYIADLKDPDQIFESVLKTSDAHRSVVVFNRDVLEHLHVSLTKQLELTSGYCENGYDPPPNKTCESLGDGPCECTLKDLGE